MRAIYLLTIALFACGDNKGLPVRPDGPPRPDAAPDAAPIECNYTETADATNDDLFGGGTAETTNLTFSTSTTAICGNVENSHLDVTVLDVDSYRLTVPTATRALVYLEAAGAENLQSTSVEISGLTTTTGVRKVGVFEGAFAVTSAVMPPGDYLITVSAYNPTAPAAAIGYKVIIVLDSAQRCPKATGTVAYPETNDGVTASGNDVYEVRYSTSPARQTTLLGADSPEPTNVTVEPNASYLITGSSDAPVSAPVSWMDDYKDRDTFRITMGATTNTLAVRLNWPGTTADLDFFVFPAGNPEEIATGWDNRNMEDEFTTLAVTPGASYDVWVAADDPSTGQPIAYELTLCGTVYLQDPAAVRASAAFPGPRRHPVFQRTVRKHSK